MKTYVYLSWYLAELFLRERESQMKTLNITIKCKAIINVFILLSPVEWDTFRTKICIENQNTHFCVQ
jgi:hypothetical protein